MPDENRPASEPQDDAEGDGPDIERSVPGSRASERAFPDDPALGHGDLSLDDVRQTSDEWYEKVFRGGDGLIEHLERLEWAESHERAWRRWGEVDPDRRNTDKLWDEVLLGHEKSAIFGRLSREVSADDPRDESKKGPETDATDEPGASRAEAPAEEPSGWAHREDPHYITVTLPDGSVVQERRTKDGKTESALSDRDKKTVGEVSRDFEELDPEVAAKHTPKPAKKPAKKAATKAVKKAAKKAAPVAGSTPSALRPRVVGIVLLVVALIVGGVIVFTGDDDGDGADGADVAGTQPRSDDGSEPGAVAPTDEPASAGSNRPWPDDAAGTACKAAHDEFQVLDLTSPDMTLQAPEPPLYSIPETYSLNEGQQSDFPSPPLEWSAVPPETTEIVVTVHDLLAGTVDDVLADPGDIWWNGLPTGRVKWLVADIDADATGLPTTSYVNPDLAGGVELDHGTRVGTSDGVDSTNRFIGPDIPGRYYLFTVFALCDPILNGNEYQDSWLVRFAVGIGSFIAES